MIFSVTEEDTSQKVSQSQAAKVLPPPVCWVSDVTAISWQLRHSLNGIQPTRAVVMMTSDVTIPDGQAFVFP